MELTPRFFTAADLRSWLGQTTLLLDQYCELLNDLNTFPVPDFNTGTHLGTTWRAAAAAVSGAPLNLGVGDLSQIAASAAREAAHGCSGALLAAGLQGAAQAWQGLTELNPLQLLAGARGAVLALEATSSRPSLPGGLVEAARRTLDELEAGELYTLASCSSTAVISFQTAVVDSAEARAGVADAGNAAVALILAALAEVCHDPAAGAATWVEVVTTMLEDFADRSRRQSGPRRTHPGGEFEVSFVWQNFTTSIEALRQDLERWSTEVIISGQPDELGVARWLVHAHVANPTAVLPRGGNAQVPVKIRHLDPPRLRSAGTEPVEERDNVRLLRPRQQVAGAPSALAPLRLIALTRAPGAVETLARTGASVVLDPAAISDLAWATQEVGLGAAGQGASLGVLLPCDEASAQWAHELAAARPEGQILVAPSRDEAAVCIYAEALAQWAQGAWSSFSHPAAALRGLLECLAQLSGEIITQSLAEAEGQGTAEVLQALARAAFDTSRPRVLYALLGAADAFQVRADLDLYLATGAFEEGTVDLVVRHGGQGGPASLGVWLR